MFAHNFGVVADSRKAASDVEFVDSTSSINQSSIPTPTNQSGDILICLCVKDPEFGDSTANWPAPTGWTKHENVQRGSSFEHAMFSKTSTGSEPSSYDFSDNAPEFGGMIACFRGGSSIKYETLDNSGNDKTGVSPSITIDVDGSMLLVSCLAAQGSEPSSQGDMPSGITFLEFVQDGSTDCGGYIGYDETLYDTGDGSTGNKSMQWETFTAWTGYSILIEP